MTDLNALDQALQRREAYWTLQPGKSRALLPTGICDRVTRIEGPPAYIEAFIEGLVGAVDAMLVAFPDNLLWDLEALAARQWTQGLEAPDPVSRVRHLWARIAQLQHVFGCQGPIRFRYIHDFIYGFDWARWVAEDPDARSGVGPYDLAFVERMHVRGAELLQLIEEGDSKYGPLPDDDARNPFGFSREPGDELALHRRLAAEGALPVQAWSAAAEPRWDRPFSQLREEAADALRISA